MAGTSTSADNNDEERRGIGARVKFALGLPIIRVMLGIGVLFMCLVGYVVWYNSHHGGAVVALQRVPLVDSTPGGKQQQENPHYQKVLDQADKEHYAEAAKKGGDALPTINLRQTQTVADGHANAGGQNSGMASSTGAGRGEGQGGKQTEEEKQAAQARLTAKIAMASELLKKWNRNSTTLVAYSAQDSGRSSGSANGGGASSTQAGANGRGGASGPTLVRMGGMVYGRNILAIDSDQPGTPALVSVEDNSVLKGARMSGSVALVNEGFVIKLNKMSWKNKDYQINALIIDPDSNVASIADSVDPRYVSRYGLQLASKFVYGMAYALSMAGQTVVASPMGTVVATPEANMRQGLMAGGAQFAQQLSSDIADAAPKGPKVKLNANSGVGILFIDTLHDSPVGQ